MQSAKLKTENGKRRRERIVVCVQLLSASDRHADWKSAIQQIRGSAPHRSAVAHVIFMRRLYTRFSGGWAAWVFECDRRGHQRTPADRRGHFFVKIPLDCFLRSLAFRQGEGPKGRNGPKRSSDLYWMWVP